MEQLKTQMKTGLAFRIMSLFASVMLNYGTGLQILMIEMMLYFAFTFRLQMLFRDLLIFELLRHLNFLKISNQQLIISIQRLNVRINA